MEDGMNPRAHGPSRKLRLGDFMCKLQKQIKRNTLLLIVYCVGCVAFPVGCKPLPEESGKGRRLQDRGQEPGAYHRAVHEAEQHNRHIRGGTCSTD